MIQPLRAVHRRVFVALAFVLPAILLIGIGGRRPRPHPGTRAAQLPAAVTFVEKSDGLWRKHAIQSDFYSDFDHPHEIYVVLQPVQDMNEPDLLLYWTVNQPSGNVLPAHPHLLGTFAAGKSFVLPQDAGHTGHLVLYSLAHQAVVDTASLEKLP